LLHQSYMFLFFFMYISFLLVYNTYICFFPSLLTASLYIVFLYLKVSLFIDLLSFESSFSEIISFFIYIYFIFLFHFHWHFHFWEQTFLFSELLSLIIFIWDRYYLVCVYFWVSFRLTLYISLFLLLFSSFSSLSLLHILTHSSPLFPSTYRPLPIYCCSLTVPYYIELHNMSHFSLHFSRLFSHFF